MKEVTVGVRLDGVVVLELLTMFTIKEEEAKVGITTPATSWHVVLFVTT